MLFSVQSNINVTLAGRVEQLSSSESNLLTGCGLCDSFARADDIFSIHYYSTRSPVAYKYT